MNISMRVITTVVVSLFILGFTGSWFSQKSIEKITKEFFSDYEQTIYNEKKINLRDVVLVVHSIVTSIYDEGKALGYSDAMI